MLRARAISIVIATASLVFFAGAVPAQANVSQGWVAGSGDVSDDFNDEGVTDINTHRQSIATGLWQTILWADGAIESNGTAFDLADIDCDFGPNTQAATRNWQSTQHIGVDGSAGPQTWGKAGVRNTTDDPAGLVLGDQIENDQYFVYYFGKQHLITMIRNGAIGVGSAKYAYISFGGNGSNTVFTSYSAGVCSSSTFV